jgi:hypothetical protein
VLSSVVFVLAHPDEKPCPEPHRTLPARPGGPTSDTRVTTLDPLRNHIVAQSDELNHMESHRCTKPRGEGVPPRSNVLAAFPPFHGRPLFSTASNFLFSQLLFTLSAPCEGSFDIHTICPRAWGEGMLLTSNLAPLSQIADPRSLPASSFELPASSTTLPRASRGKSFRFHSYEKTASKPFRIHSYKITGFKVLWNHTLAKKGGGGCKGVN